MKKVRDHYFDKAKREGYAARAVYKLEQIDRRRHLLRNGQRVLDLGAAPGSWTQYAAQRVGTQGRVVALDLQPLGDSLPTQVRTLQADVHEVTAETLLQGEAPFDVVLSDMAPHTTGIRQADAARSAQLVERVLELARAVLRPGGTLLVKVFQGGQTGQLRQALQRDFERVTVEKPQASRSESVEVYLLATGRRTPPA